MVFPLRRFLIFFALALIAAPTLRADPATSGWTMGLSCPPKGADGAGTLVAATGGGFGAAGSCRRLPSLFTKLTVATSAGGTLRAADFYALQTPSVLIVPPLLTTESQPVFSVATACPVASGTTDLNWLFVQWTESERRALSSTYLFGTATYSAVSGLNVTGQYDIDGTLYFSGNYPMTGTCVNGDYTVSGNAAADTLGSVTFNAGGMGVFKTSTGRATFFFPRFALTVATHFGGKSFRGITFDSYAGNGVNDVRQVRGNADGAGTSFTLEPFLRPSS